MDTDAPRDPRLDPIGVFDSGIGGLTVAAALKKHPALRNDFLYRGHRPRPLWRQKPENR